MSSAVQEASDRFNQIVDGLSSSQLRQFRQLVLKKFDVTDPNFEPVPASPVPLTPVDTPGQNILTFTGFSRRGHFPATPAKSLHVEDLWATDWEKGASDPGRAMSAATTWELCNLPEIMHAVQVARVFEDCKHFSDMGLRRDPEEVRRAWNEMDSLKRVDKEALRAFVDEHFLPPGADNETFDEFPDWTSDPDLTKLIKDPVVRQWAHELNNLWRRFGRITPQAVRDHPDRFTVLPLPHPFIVPGGRFREFYYWDTFWIVLGLMHCGMVETARGVVLNLVHLVKTYGFMPNGTRKYYLNRSQPPMLCEMVLEVWQKTQDDAFLLECLPALEDEYRFFMQAPRGVDIDMGGGVTVKLNRFFVNSNQPRPESYREDLEQRDKCAATEEEARTIYSHLAGAAESGWDFSARWFRDPNNIGSCKTGWILPVDLNCILYKFERNMAGFHSQLGTRPGVESRFVFTPEGQGLPSEDSVRDYCSEFGLVHHAAVLGLQIVVIFSKPIEDVAWLAERHVIGGIGGRFEGCSASVWRGRATRRHNAIEALMYDESKQMWFDYDCEQRQRTTILAASGFYPLWAGCCTQKQAALAVQVLELSPLSCKGGVACTALFSHQQWDYPCGWPPVQWFMVEGLRRTATRESVHLAEKIAIRWLYSNLAGYENSQKMYEKYDVRALGFSGWGGEYEQQDGFGWTNGVALHLLSLYHKKLSYTQYERWIVTDSVAGRHGSREVGEVQHSLHVSRYQVRKLMQHIQREGHLGLSGHVSSLTMVASFITPQVCEAARTTTKPVDCIAIGVGGASLCVARCRIRDGAMDNLRIKYYSDKEHWTTPTTAKAMAESLVDRVIDMLTATREEPDFRTTNFSVGISWRFPLRTLAVDSAIASYATELAASDLHGQDVCALMQAAFASRGLRNMRVSCVLSDVVAALVAKTFETGQSYSGAVIIGTGVNMAYWEKVSNIRAICSKTAKSRPYTGLTEGEMAVVADWADLSVQEQDPETLTHHEAFPLTSFDKVLDSTSNNAGTRRFEKCTGGAYLGELCRLALVSLMQKKVIRHIPALLCQGCLRTQHLTRVLNDTTATLEETERYFKEVLHFTSLDSERHRFREVCMSVVRRAGRFLAAGIAAVADLRQEKVCRIAVQGGVYENLEALREQIDLELQKLFAHTGTTMELQFVKDGHIRGALVAAAGCSLLPPHPPTGHLSPPMGPLCQPPAPPPDTLEPPAAPTVQGTDF